MTPRRLRLFTVGTMASATVALLLLAGPTNAADSPQTPVAANPSPPPAAAWNGGGIANAAQQQAINGAARRALGSRVDSLYILDGGGNSAGSQLLTTSPTTDPGFAPVPTVTVVQRGDGVLHVRVFPQLSTSAIAANGGSMAVTGTAFNIATDGTMTPDSSDTAGANVTSVTAVPDTGQPVAAKQGLMTAAALGPPTCNFAVYDPQLAQGLFGYWYAIGTDFVNCDQAYGSYQDTDTLSEINWSGGSSFPSIKIGSLPITQYGWLASNTAQALCRGIGWVNGNVWANKQQSSVWYAGYKPETIVHNSYNDPTLWCSA